MELDHSPDGDLGPDRKRRRKVLSCMDCRRRKVQCDRVQPVCSRCEKAGKQCTYEDDISTSQNGSIVGQQGSALSLKPPASVTVSKEIWDDMLSRLLQQERVIERFQCGFGSPVTPRTVPVATPQLDLAETPRSIGDDNQKETILFRGKGFKSFYYGPSDARSAMTVMPNAHAFFREEIHRFPALIKCRRDVEKLRAVKKVLDKPIAPRADLMSYLPDRDKSDSTVKLYFNHVDSIYGFMHFPSFQKEYEKLWQEPQAARPAFVAVVLLMVACVQGFFESKLQTFVADSPMPREIALGIVDACGAWLAKQSQKHTDLAYFQIHCLLLIAKQANCIKRKTWWLEAGNMFRLAVSAGMHRHTDLLMKRATVFEQEMRRRIWAFVVEWDLQESIDRGMPAVSSSIASDCGLPSNLYDQDFDPSTSTLPQCRPSSELTKVSYSRISAQSRSLRANITTALNQPGHHISYDEVLAYTQELERQITALPGFTGSELRELTGSDQTISLLHIQLEQLLVVLHGRAARQATTKTHANFSRQLFLTASGSIINKLSDLFIRGSRFLVMVRLDLQMIFTSIATLGTVHDKDASAQDLRNQIQPSLDIADKALDLFEEKILCAGGLQWTHAFAMYDMLLTRIHPLGKNMGSRPGSERIYNVCKKILDNQDPDFAIKSAAIKDSVPTPKKKKGNCPDYNNNYNKDETHPEIGTEDDVRQPMRFPEGDFLPNLGYSDMLDWAIDDWMLYADTLWQQDMPLPLAESSSLAEAIDGQGRV